MEDCHCWGETKVGEPWAISEDEYPVGLQGKATADLEVTAESEKALQEMRLEFDQHVRWFRRLVLGSDVLEVVRHGGRDGIGLRMRKTCDVPKV